MENTQTPDWMNESFVARPVTSTGSGALDGLINAVGDFATSAVDKATQAVNNTTQRVFNLPASTDQNAPVAPLDSYDGAMSAPQTDWTVPAKWAAGALLAVGILYTIFHE